MGEDKKPIVSSHMTSAAAFVEGGIQDSCDDACSICLEEFSESDPATVTNCKHDFHLQCILEWCQRSSECPMCLRLISLKDPASQELLEATERERNLRAAPSRNSTMINHPMLDDFQLQRLPVGVYNPELEERMIQHLAAAAAAMGRDHHFGRREGQRNRSSTNGGQQFLVFSTNPGFQYSGNISSSPTPVEGQNEPAAFTPTSPSNLVTAYARQPYQPAIRLASSNTNRGTPTSESSVTLASPQIQRMTPSQSSTADHNRSRSSEFQSFSESLKSRFNAVSMRYRESISRSTRGWKERLFSRSNSTSNLGSEVREEGNDGIASVSRMMGSLHTRDNTRVNRLALLNHSIDCYTQRTPQNSVENPCLNESVKAAPCTSSSSTT